MGPVTSDAPYAFVSYSSADRARVFGITGVLEAQGVPLWLDRRSISGGRRWTTEIVRGVEDAAVLLVMCSPASVASRNVQQEVQLAWESERRILPVIVEEVQLPAELRYALAGQQWVEVRERPESEWLPELLGALRNLGIHERESDQPDPPDAKALPAAEEFVQEKRLHNLPAPRTSFVGRATELEDVASTLAEHRVVTLTGSGGVGKSRLALELAWRLLPNYSDGVWLVSLETATDPSLVPELVASAAGVRELPGRPLMLQLADRLSSRNALLILDNCEHLLDPCADLAGSLTAGGRGLRVLATSRELLGIAGEQVMPISPLQVPALSAKVSASELRDSESVQLFLDRARSVFPQFELTTGNAVAVAEICRALDGIPLAIELAGARIRALTPEQLLSRLSDMFGLLRGTDRTALPRQRTLQGAVDWSYDSLEDEERVLWRRLSVFPESFTLGAAEAVCGFDPLTDYEILDLLTGLVDKSLVMTVRGGFEAQYHLLRTLRQYARDRLSASGEESDLQDRHAAWCIEVVGTVDFREAGEATAERQRLLRLEYPNLRAALGHLVRSDRVAQALEIAGTYGMTALFIGQYPSEGRKLLELILAEAPPDQSLSRAKALWGLGWLQGVALQTEQAKATLGEALETAREAGEQFLVVRILNALGASAWYGGHYEQAEAMYGEAVEHARRHGLSDQGPLCNLALVLTSGGEMARAREIHEQNVRQFAERHGRWPGWDSIGLGWIALWEGDLEEAGRLADLAAASPTTRLRCEALSLRGASLAQAGRINEALTALEEALRVALDSGEAHYVWRSLTWLGHTAAKQDDLRRAVTLLAAAEEAVAFHPKLLEMVATVREQAAAKLGPEELEARRAVGAAMSLDQAAMYALEWLQQHRGRKEPMGPVRTSGSNGPMGSI